MRLGAGATISSLSSTRAAVRSVLSELKEGSYRFTTS